MSRRAEHFGVQMSCASKPLTAYAGKADRGQGS